MRLLDFFDGAQSETAPTIGNIIASGIITYDSDASYEASEQGSPLEGNIYFNTTTNLLRYYNGTKWIDLVDDESVQTLINKTIDADQNTITNLEDDNIKAGAAIDVTKLHDGSVDNTEFGYLDGVTSGIQAQIDSKQDVSEKGQPSGYASLDATGLVPAGQLPSYVDDVLEFADFASFPATGETGKIYIALDTNLTYRWSGSVYVQISSGVDQLSDLTDVDTTGVQDGEVLVYNQANSRFEPGEGGGASQENIALVGKGTAQCSITASTGVVYNNTTSTDFNGSDERITIPGVAANNLGAGSDFSISFYIKTTQAATAGIVNTWVTGSSDRQWMARLESSGQLSLFASSDGSGFTWWRSSNIFNDGEWHHVVMAFTGGAEARLSVNGTNESFPRFSGSVIPNVKNVQNDISIGATNASAPSAYFDGQLDEVGLWSVALTSNEAAELFNGQVNYDITNHSQSANLISWYRMGDGDTAPVVIDQQGVSNGTMTNMDASNFVLDTIPGKTSNVVAVNRHEVGDYSLSPNIGSGFTFTPDADGELDSVNINLADRGLANGDGDVRLYLYATSGGLPTGVFIESSQTIYATSNLTASSGTVIPVSFTFIGNTALSAGVEYAMVIESSDTGPIIVRNSDVNFAFSSNFNETGVNTGVFTNSVNQDTIGFEVLFDNLATNVDAEIVLDSDMFISVPPLPNSYHKIAAQTINLQANQCAYVTIDRAAVSDATLPVTVDNISNVASDNNKIIFLRADDTACHLGFHDPQRLDDGDVVNVQRISPNLVNNTIETKVLTSNVTSDVTISDLTFTGLEIGKVYELNLQFAAEINDTVLDPGLAINVVHDSQVIARTVFTVRQSDSLSGDNLTSSCVVKFEATASTLTFDAISATVNSYIIGDNTRINTFAQLEKRERTVMI